VHLQERGQVIKAVLRFGNDGTPLTSRPEQAAEGHLRGPILGWVLRPLKALAAAYPMCLDHLGGAAHRGPRI
jgi:hypothetical protein